MINLTENLTTPAQRDLGVLEPVNKTRIQRLLTFSFPPTGQTIKARAQLLAASAALELYERGQSGIDCAVLIGGESFFMAPLEAALKVYGIKAFYGFENELVTNND